MAGSIEKVSLGFAEFIAQLLQETYESILSTQTHQLERFLEMEQAIKMPAEKFASTYINGAQRQAKMKDIFGKLLRANMKVDKELQETIFEKIGRLRGIFKDAKLTAEGFEKVKLFIEELLVDEQKGILEIILNQSDTPQLIVDSGEITAKLELSNWLEEEVSPTSKIRRPMKIREYEDPDTKRKFLLLDRRELENIPQINWTIPQARLVATPLNSRTDTQVFAEVKINFKNR